MTMKIEGVIASSHDYEIVRLFRSMGIELLSSSLNPKCLVLGGGADIHPSLYFEEEDSKTMTGSMTRDLRELQLINEAKLKKIPVFGICRGFQMMHVALGGTLHQHINGHRSGIHHLIDPMSRTRTSFTVNSTHHQAVPWNQAQTVYEGGVMVGEGEDRHWHAETGFSEERKFFGVQYHPERTSCSSKATDWFKTKVEQLMVKG